MVGVRLQQVRRSSQRPRSIRQITRSLSCLMVRRWSIPPTSRLPMRSALAPVPGPVSMTSSSAAVDRRVCRPPCTPGSEELRTGLVEPIAAGGQAGTSSMIRNYLCFPPGVSGAELAARAFEQPILFGADFVYGSPVTRLHTHGGLKRPRLPVVIRSDARSSSSRQVSCTARSTFPACHHSLVPGRSTAQPFLRPERWTVTTSWWWAAATLRVKRRCTWRSSRVGCAASSGEPHWPRACRTTSSPSWRRRRTCLGKDL